MLGPDRPLALLGGPPVRPTPLPYAHQTIEPDDLGAVSDALTADWITQGPIVVRFENIGATVHYPLAYRHPFNAERFGYSEGLCPNAEAVEARPVTLPLFPAMTEADQDDVLRASTRS